MVIATASVRVRFTTVFQVISRIVNGADFDSIKDAIDLSQVEESWSLTLMGATHVAVLTNGSCKAELLKFESFLTAIESESVIADDEDVTGNVDSRFAESLLSDYALNACIGQCEATVLNRMKTRGEFRQAATMLGLELRNGN